MTEAAVNLGPDFTVRRAPGAIVKDLQGTVVVAAAEGGQGHCMDSIGQRIWSYLERPRSLAELSEMLCTEYDVDPATCLRDTTTFLRELIERGLVVAGQPAR